MPRRRSPQIPAPRAIGSGPGQVGAGSRIAGLGPTQVVVDGQTAPLRRVLEFATGGTMDVSYTDDPANGKTTVTVDHAAGYTGAQWAVVAKTADESRTSTTTFADDDTLRITLEANTRYRIKGDVRFSAAVAAGIKFQLVGPSGLARCSVSHWGIAGGATALSAIGIDKALSTPTTLVGTGADGWWAFDAMIETGASGGTLAMQWAQSDSSLSASAVQRGSTLEWRSF